MARRRMEIGIQTNVQWSGYDELLAIWQTAEREGLDHAWTYDHLLPIFSDAGGPCFEGWTALTALLLGAPRLRGGVLVSCNGYRHPAVLAKMAATLDVISGGRLEVGLGGGWAEIEFRTFGLPFPPTAERLQAMDEAAAILRSLWTQPRTTFQGRWYTITDAPCEPKPAQARLPLWIGGAGRDLTLRTVARHADGWNVWAMAREEYGLLLAALDRHCEQAQRDPASVRRSILTPFAIAETSAGVAAKHRALAQQIKPPFEDILKSALVGTPEAIAEQVARWAESGVDHLILLLNAPYNHEDLTLFAREVAPKLRAAGL